MINMNIYVSGLWEDLKFVVRVSPEGSCSHPMSKDESKTSEEVEWGQINLENVLHPSS